MIWFILIFSLHIFSIKSNVIWIKHFNTCVQRSENEQESFQVAQVPPFHLFKTTKVKGTSIYFSFVEFI